MKAKQSNGDVLFVYTNEEESARLVRELRKQGYAKPIVGDTTLVSQKAIEFAGDAANGIQGHVPLTVDAPTAAMRAFDEKFSKEYKYKSDHNGIQGYMVPYIIKAVSEKIGKVDSKAFAAAIKDMPLYVKDAPGLLVDTKFDKNGDPDRVSYIVEVKGWQADRDGHAAADPAVLSGSGVAEQHRGPGSIAILNDRNCRHCMDKIRRDRPIVR